MSRQSLGWSCFGLAAWSYTDFARDRIARRPFEQRQETLHALDELHWLPASRITALRFHVVALLREQRQMFANVSPRVGIFSKRLREHPRVFEMAEADVIG